MKKAIKAMFVLSLFFCVLSAFSQQEYKVSNAMEITPEMGRDTLQEQTFAKQTYAKQKYAASVVRVIPGYTTITVEMYRINISGARILISRSTLKGRKAYNDGLLYFNEPVSWTLMYHNTGEVTLIDVNEGYVLLLQELNCPAND